MSKNSFRFIVYTVIIGTVFYSGIFFYSIYTELNAIKIETITVKEYRPILEKYNPANFNLWAEGKKISIDHTDTKNWLELYIRNYSDQEDMRVSSTNILEYLESLAPHVNIQPVNAQFKYAGNRAQIFLPSNHGRKLNISQSLGLISSAIFENKASASLVFETVEPDITLEKINNLGIKTLLGRGESDYGKSPASRIHNIKIGMAKFNGVILKPGEEFSFNNFLGTVEEKDGYQSELVIKGGLLVKEYGGGLCQVSTTVFRAAILAGLPITERKSHSFPVQYYNPQGFDSTIYPGVIDLKFVNDTPDHVLIQTKVTGSKLVVEIYGSSDSREVKIGGPIQYDQKRNGSMKAYLTRKIYKNNQLAREERFDSTYKPPPPSPLERNPLE